MSYQADYSKLFLKKPQGSNGGERSSVGHGMPKRTHTLISAYIETGIDPGGFLQAVFENDLMGAVLRGDEDNRNNLKQIIKFLIDNAPSKCFGSKEAYEAWRKKGGVSG
tara:strand:+ start:2144 stop:2470 length:327 start_codon:yes stop_codon:yes gene_type:complete